MRPPGRQHRAPLIAGVAPATNTRPGRDPISQTGLGQRFLPRTQPSAASGCAPLKSAVPYVRSGDAGGAGSAYRLRRPPNWADASSKDTLCLARWHAFVACAQDVRGNNLEVAWLLAAIRSPELPARAGLRRLLIRENTRPPPVRV